jgi:hypothetical protein
MASARDARQLQHILDVAQLLEATMTSWMGREELRFDDGAVPGGVAEFTARMLQRCLQEIPADRHTAWMHHWTMLLRGRLAGSEAPPAQEG